jgi:hypothetical protein
MTASSESTNGRPGAEGWGFELPRSEQTRIGISLSGGGIRSATFSLGVYQRLAEAGIFQRARFLSAVSGGGYLACGLAISHATFDARNAHGHPPPWWRGSPEAASLRRNLSYLAPEGEGRLWLGANLLYGVILNLAPLVLGAYAIGHLVGFVLQKLYPGIGHDNVDVSAAMWVAVAIGAAVALAVLAVGWRRFFDKYKQGREAPTRFASPKTSTYPLMVAAAATGLLVVMPLAVDALAPLTSADKLDELGIAEFPWRVQRILLGLVGVVAALGLGAVALWLQSRRRFRLLRSVLAAIAGGAVLLVPFTLATETGAVMAWSFERDGVMLIIAAIVIVLFAVFAHNRRYSMHLFYCERIQEAFALQRFPSDSGEIEAKPISYQQRIPLSKVAAENRRRTEAGDEPFPNLVVCAAVAARGSEVPSRAWAASFTFEGERSGNQRLGLQASTTEFEKGDWIGGGGLTLPSMMAISGAALSPMMGRFTLPAFRFLMAVMNIRLGVWLRNPNEEFEPDLPRDAPRIRRAWRYVKRGWREPGAWYVLKEGLGRAGARGKFIYVSDGGHWENLGLTELLRRRCTNIVAVDASGAATLADIGRAMSVARAELGIEFKFDPRPTAPGEDGLATSPVAVGTFEYPDGQRGDIAFARCVLWDGAPADLQMFAAENRLFPNHPTANQFLSGEVFDAYRALGYAVGIDLAGKVGLPPARQDEPRTDDGSAMRVEPVMTQ